MIQRQGGGHRTLAEGNTLLETDTFYTGPGILLSRLTGFYESLMLIAHTPVDDGRIKAWHALLVKSEQQVARGEDVEAARAFQADSLAALHQDFEIWTAKAPALRILQIRSDGPFHKVREWYQQFYQPAPDKRGKGKKK